MKETEKLIPCIGCGALIPDIDGPTHSYIGASPGCWAIFGDLMAEEFGKYRYPPVHSLTVDTYAVQHPGRPSRKSIQSVAVHLISLYRGLERDSDSMIAVNVIRRALRHREKFVWLDPPPSLGAITILDVRGAKDLIEHTERIKRWASSVWDAWSPHHKTIKKWAEL